MVDVGDKPVTRRMARAAATVRMRPETLHRIREENMGKGDVLGVARLAGIMAAKRTADMIPLCHPLALTHVSVEFETDAASSSVRCTARVETFGKTGVEMEALTAVQVGLLTVYDMSKAVDKTMVMTDICVTEKRGGKSDISMAFKFAKQQSTPSIDFHGVIRKEAEARLPRLIQSKLSRLLAQ